MDKEKVRIEELSGENWYECCSLELFDDQKEYMEPNAVSIAQSKFEPTLKPYAIYFDDKITGFLMFNSVMEELQGHWVYRIMIDKAFQGKGIGKAATELMIAEMSKLPHVKKIIVGYHPENMAAHHLYSQLGFTDEGHRFGKEMAVIKTINK
ncbi:GNAT family N-acetyltransferase [Peribacillus sp. SCS-26]|uniref:GNAT family N-acetyltransferase n=1 Tax=Paraperibacillus marinus TaxID=3115295 RepID=UPI0039067D79